MNVIGGLHHLSRNHPLKNQLHKYECADSYKLISVGG